MYGTHNAEQGLSDNSEQGKNPLDNHYIKHWIYGGCLFKPLNHQELITIRNFLENKNFDKQDKYKYENIRNRIKYTCKETGFIGEDFNILEKILDKLYNYFTEYKKSLSEDINKRKNSTSTNECREDFIRASIYASKYTEEHLIEILQMRHILDSCKKSKELYRLLCCNGQFEVESKNLGDLKEGHKDEIKIDLEHQLYKQIRVEKLILDYFGDYEDQIKYLEELEKKYHDNLVKNDELFRKMQRTSRAGLEPLEIEVEKLKWDRWIIRKNKISVAESGLKRPKDKIYELVKKFGIVLSEDLRSKLGKYSDFSDLLIENDKKISDAEEAEVVEVDI